MASNVANTQFSASAEDHFQGKGHINRLAHLLYHNLRKTSIQYVCRLQYLELYTSVPSSLIVV